MSKTKKQKRHRASGVCLERGLVLMVRLRDPKTGIERLFPPGGLIEPGESPEDCAVRETLEETGFHVSPARRAPQRGILTIRYDFEWNGVVYDCVTHFVRCELAEELRAPERVKDADYNKGAIWVPASEVSDALAFHEPIRKAVLDVIGLA